MNSRDKNLVIVRSVLDQGLSIAEAAARFSVSRQWIHVLLTRYRLEGPDGLEPRSRAPRTHPGATPEALREEILRLRRSLTADGADAGPLTIAWHLEQAGLHAPSTSTIRRLLHAEGLITPAPRKRPRSSYRRFQAELPNECWQADITHAFLAPGRRVEVLDFLDDHSRYLLHLRAAAAFTGPMIVDAMNTLITTNGAPASTLTDNGLVFTARLAGRKGGRNGFEKLLQAHRIRQKNGRPGHPQTQGKIERFHQTLHRWLDARPRPETIEELQDLLDQFRNWYNTARPHRATGRRTPEQAYTALPKATPDTLAEPEWRTRVDTVDRNGKVSLRYSGKMRHLGIGRAHIGEHILMLIHDDQVTVTNAATGEVLAEHLIDPTKDYQPALERTHRPRRQKPPPDRTANPRKES